MAQRSIAWVKDGGLGMEFTEVSITARRMQAVGVALGTSPLPYRLDYRFGSRSRFITKSIEAVSRGQG